MRVMASTTAILVAILLATTGCYFSSSPKLIQVPKGAVIEIYEVVPTPANNTKPAADPATGKPIHLLTPPLIAIGDIDTIGFDANRDQPGQPMLLINLTTGGAQKMLAATTNPTATHLALIVNGQVVSVPKIVTPIQGSMVVTGGGGNKAAFDNACQMFAGK